MTQEEKELLLKDLSGRLQYGVICKTHIGSYKLLGIDETTIHLDSPIYDEGDGFFDLEYVEIKPYLRPMSSMTEGERNEYFDFRSQELQRVAFAEIDREYAIAEISDWLYAHHLDFRGLIPMGLALEAKEGMYTIK